MPNAREEARNQGNARRIHRFVKRTPATKIDICEALDITSSEFSRALRYSRTTLDSDKIANEIIGVTASEPYMYYAAKNYDQAQQYLTQRSKLADSHLASVEKLMEKELDKYPDKGREITIALTTVKRMREDMVWLLAD